MLILMLANITSTQFKNTYNQSIPCDLIKHQSYVLDDTIATDLLGKGEAKVHQGEVLIAGELYEPVTNPHNPFNDMANVPDDIAI